MRHGDLRARPSGRSLSGSSHYLGTETSRPPPRRVSRDGPCAGLSEGQVPSVTKPAPFVTDDGEGRRTLSTGQPRAPVCTVRVEQIVVRCNELEAVTKRIDSDGEAAEWILLLCRSSARFHTCLLHVRLAALPGLRAPGQPLRNGECGGKSGGVPQPGEGLRIDINRCPATV
jgi:hypothetical protein